MDPASAIGVAAAAVQFFAIGIKAFRLGKQICASKTGSTEANEALEGSLKAISDIRKDLRHDIIRDANSNIAKAQKQCLEIAEKLLKVLESIKASSQTAKSKFLKDVSATWQVMRARSKIDKLEQELRVAQDHFKEALTVETRNAIAQVLERQGKDTTMLQSMWDEIQSLRPEIQQARKENNAAHRETLSGVARIEEAYTTQQTIIQSTQQATLGAIENLDTNVQAQFNDMRMTDVHHEILGTLRYPDMLTRQQEISPPAPGTYEWIFTGESPYQNDPDIDKDFLSADLERREKLLHWFSTDESLFWINGKPGSGKSSLMSFLANDERTLQELDSWSGQRPVHIIKFFFWRPGSPLQRSVSGLLRSLLYQTLMIDTSVIDKLLAEKSLRRHPTWEQSHLLRTLETVLKLQSKEHICFFIDGLDEHDGEYMTLLDLVLRTRATPKVKICLSSRPEPAFRLRLSACPSISMQDLNKYDIETLVQQKLEPIGSNSTSLIEEVTGRAEGIILWAALVCNSLLRGYTMYDDEPMLRKRLDETPSGLRELFRHMFSKIDNAHRENLRIYCHILKWASQIKYKTYYTSLTFVTAVSQSSGIMSMADLVKICPSREQQIVAQSQGLIEVIIHEDDPVIGLWSVRQVVDQGIIQSKSHGLTKDLFEHSRQHIQWVHRSAHDCIFGDRGESVAQWIFMNDDVELKRKAVECLLWLAENCPMFVMRNYGGIAVLDAALDDLIQDIIPLISQNEGCQIVGKLHDLVVSAFPGQNRQNCRKELQYVGAGEPMVINEMLLLYSLWVGVLCGGQHSYINQLLEKPFAAEMCSRLICNGFCGDNRVFMCRLLDCISRDLEPRTDGNIVLNGFLHKRHFGLRQRFTSVHLSPVVCSWQGSCCFEEAHIMHDLAALRGLVLGPSLPDSLSKRVLAVLQAREVWRGPQALDKLGNMLPLQLLLPNIAFNQMWAIGQLSAGSLPPHPTSPFRIMCLRRNTQTSVSRTPLLQLSYEHQLVALFDLSVTATATLLSQSQWWTRDEYHECGFAITRNLEMTWLGTPADYSSCLRALLDDIWQDRHQQLDAWQQLYALTCVKLCFRRMWKIGSKARVSEWTGMDYLDRYSVHESSSNEEI
jgi:hypothetical protein